MVSDRKPHVGVVALSSIIRSTRSPVSSSGTRGVLSGVRSLKVLPRLRSGGSINPTPIHPIPLECSSGLTSKGMKMGTQAHSRTDPLPLLDLVRYSPPPPWGDG